jgi:acyl-CoA synthetase (AMP-forming)/AMP-acid ligase II
MNSVLESVIGRDGFATLPAIIDREAITYGALVRRAEQLSRVLVRKGGVGTGDVVAICVPHGADQAVSLLAGYMAGAVVLLVNPQSTPAELDQNIGSARVRAILVEDPRWIEQSAAARWRQDRTDSLTLCVADSEQQGWTFEANERFIIFTSGSTGVPKGVVLTEQGVSANVRATADYLSLAQTDRSVVFTPPGYAFALSQLLTHLWVGGSVVSWRGGLRYPAELARLIRHGGATGIAGNPSALRILLASASALHSNLEHVRYVMSGGQVLERKLAQELSAWCPNAGIVNMYGCTENSPRISYYWASPDLSFEPDPLPVGQPVQGTQVRINDPDDAGVGEISISGTSLMSRYLDDEALTRERVRDGWFYTGDLARVNGDANLELNGRVDNQLNVGSEKISAEAIELLVGKIDGVEDCAVGPVDDRLLGQGIGILVVPGAGTQNLPSVVRRECRAAVTAGKGIKVVHLVDEIPRTKYGKVDRRHVKEILVSPKRTSS